MFKLYGITRVFYPCVEVDNILESLALFTSSEGSHIVCGPVDNPNTQYREVLISNGNNMIKIAENNHREHGIFSLACFQVVDLDESIHLVRERRGQVLVDKTHSLLHPGMQSCVVSIPGFGIAEFITPVFDRSTVKLNSECGDNSNNSSVDATGTSLNNVFRQVFQSQCLEKIEEMTMETLDDWDSLKQLQLIMSLEQTFSISIPVDQLVTLNSYIKIKSYLDKVGF